MFGIPVKERLRRTVETVELLRKAWTGQRFSFQGRHYSFDQVQVTPRPTRAEGIPIWLGGMAQQAVRRAGRLGDGYIRTRGGGPEDMKRDFHIAEEAAREAGKDLSRFAYAQLQNVFAWDEGDAWDVVKEGAAHQLGVYAGWAGGSDTPGQGFFIGDLPEEALRHMTPSGTPQELIRLLRPRVEPFAGGNFHLIVRLHYPGMDFETAAHAMEVFSERVLPALKGE